MDVKLLVTNEFNGQIEGMAHLKSQDIPFISDAPNLETIPPCDFITARPIPKGNSSQISFQVQNFGHYAVQVITGNLKAYATSGVKKTILYPNSIEEFRLNRDENIIIVPFLPPPPDFRARIEVRNTPEWGDEERVVSLRWSRVPEAIGYRIYKTIWFKEKRKSDWSVYQQWYVDTNLDYFWDSDFRFENFEGYDDDTVYTINALAIGNNPGCNSNGIYLSVLRNSQSEWVPAR